MNMLRSTLVSLLNKHRNNDVYVEVPLETGGDVRVAVMRVTYDETTDVIVLHTEMFYDGPEDDPAPGGEH